jgi:chorismate-pyruvate lyase
MSESTMRFDLRLALKRCGIDPSTLGELQRVLLTTDGTVADVLEAFYREPMKIAVLAQDRVFLPEGVPALKVDKGHEVLRREILQQGSISGSYALYARSLIVLDRLSEEMRAGLLEKQKLIGYLMLQFRMETFKEIIDCAREPSGALSKYFQIDPAAPLVCRTYTISSSGQPLMLLTEKFPEFGR